MVLEHNISDCPKLKKIIDVALEPVGKGFRRKIANAILGVFDPLESIPPHILDNLELLHYSTLIHDDIIDRSDMRRGHRSIWRTYSPDIAILVGDLLHANSFGLTLSESNLQPNQLLDLFSEFSLASSKVQQGQLLEIINRFNTKLTLKEYLRTASFKTSSMIYLACYIGWIYSTNDMKVLRCLKYFSENFGKAFQIYNDVIDFQNVHGKESLDDFKNGTITLPLILLFNQYRKKQQPVPKLHETNSSCDLFDTLISDILSSGVLHESARLCNNYCQRAEHYLRLALKGQIPDRIKEILNRFQSVASFEFMENLTEELFLYLSNNTDERIVRKT